MTCADFKERAFAYALGALDAEERRECDAHLASPEAHDGCFAALREANEAAAAVGASMPAIAPSAALWPAIERQLERAPRARRSAPYAWALAAALLLVVVWLSRERDQLQAALQSAGEDARREHGERARCAEALARSEADAAAKKDALDLLTHTGTRLVALAPQAGSTTEANVIVNAASRRAYLVGKGLTAPSGKDYELWFIRGEQKIAAGLLRGDGGDGLLTAIDGRLLENGMPDAFAVTLEPAGGGTAPQGPIVLVGKPGPT